MFSIKKLFFRLGSHREYYHVALMSVFHIRMIVISISIA